tara:strand:- start:2187 stop:2405 length:219 start_codon:yes stop_codon:yes gene_type:complete
MFMTDAERLKAIRALASATKRLTRDIEASNKLHHAAAIISELQCAMDALNITRMSTHESALTVAKRYVGGEA